MTSGSLLPAIFLSTSLTLHTCCSAQVCPDLSTWISGRPRSIFFGGGYRRETCLIGKRLLGTSSVGL